MFSKTIIQTQNISETEDDRLIPTPPSNPTQFRREPCRVRCNVLVPRKKNKKKNEIRSRAGGDRHPRTLHMQHTHTLRHRGSSVLVGGLRSGPPHSTDKCLAPARPQSAFTGQQIRTGGHTPSPFTLQSVYLRVCVCV